MRITLNRCGVSLLEVSIALILFGGGILLLARGFKAGHQVENDSAESNYATLYATELLEFFRAHSSQDLINYMKNNPVAASPYYLCAHINVLDRANNRLVNPDPLADLPANAFGPKSDLYAPNRYYQVNVVDLQTLQILKNPYCDRTATTMPVLTGNQRLMVTVSVKWRNTSNLQEERVETVSTILPNT